MDEAEYRRYIDLYNRGEYAEAVAKYYHPDVQWLIHGKPITHGAQDTLRYMIEVHEGTTETLTIKEFRADKNGTDMYVRNHSTLTRVATGKNSGRLPTGPLAFGGVTTTTYDVHYELVGGKIFRINLEPGP